MKKILVIGSANADLTIHADRMPKLGETILGHDFSVNSGGKGANQAVAAAKLGGDVTFIGAVGNDGNGQKLLSDLNKNGVTFEGIVSKEAATGTASITVIDGDNFIILNAGANDLMTPKAIEEKAEIIKTADFLIMQLEIPVESVLKAAEIAKSSGTVVVINPAPYKELPEKLFELTDYMIPNEHEVQLLTGIEVCDEISSKKAIDFLLKKGVKNAIITLGEKGCAYNDGDRIIFYPAEETNAVDSTSAGDSFIGALFSKLADGKSLNDSIGYATKVAAITVSRKGASESIPFAYEIV